MHKGTVLFCLNLELWIFLVLLIKVKKISLLG